MSQYRREGLVLGARRRAGREACWGRARAGDFGELRCGRVRAWWRMHATCPARRGVQPAHRWCWL